MSDDDKTFNQAQVDELVQARLAKERAEKARLTEQLAEMESLREKAAKLDEIEQASASELEKAIKRAEKAEKERDDARGQLQDVTVRSAVIAEASKQGAVDPEVVAQLVDRSAIQFVDGKALGADKAVEGLLEAKAFLKAPDGGQPQPGPVDGGARQPAPSSDPALDAGSAILGLIASGQG